MLPHPAVHTGMISAKPTVSQWSLKAEEPSSSPRTTINDLNFEVLDLILAHFSEHNTGRSYYDNIQDLLAFCQVSRAFHKVARLHLSRFIPIASTFKARTILAMCDDTFPDSFSSRLHALSLVWPDAGKYATRRTSVITESEYLALLCAFPAMRSLELVCLPYPRIEELRLATMASTDILANVRSLALHSSPHSLRDQEYQVLPALLGLMPSLERLSIANIALNAVEVLGTPNPTFRLKELKIRISRCRVVEPSLLAWALEATVAARSCRNLTVWLSTRVSDSHEAPAVWSNDGIPTTVKVDEGFKGIETSLVELAPSVEQLSLLGLRTGQVSAILSKTTHRLRILELYGTFGFEADLLHDLRTAPDTNLAHLSFLPIFGPEWGGALPTTDIAALSRATDGRIGAASRSRSQPTLAASTQAQLAQATSSTTSGRSGTLAPSATSNPPGGHQQEETGPHTFTEVPVSSQSFVQELGSGGRLEKLEKLTIPDNARFGRRGRWLNKETIKACRRNGVWIDQLA